MLDLNKNANDIRLLASGPRTGLAEILLPAVQPGSSIMPGKVNPSIAEMVNQVCYQALGLDTTVAMAAEAGQLELNVMMPVMTHNVVFAMLIVGNASRVLAERCVEGIEADEAQCRYWLERSPALVTALAPKIGYAEAAKLAKEAVASGLTVFNFPAASRSRASKREIRLWSDVSKPRRATSTRPRKSATRRAGE